MGFMYLLIFYQSFNMTHDIQRKQSYHIHIVVYSILYTVLQVNMALSTPLYFHIPKIRPFEKEKKKKESTQGRGVLCPPEKAKSLGAKSWQEEICKTDQNVSCALELAARGC